MTIKPMPKEEGFEMGIKLLREGYKFISNHNKIYQSDVFETKYLGKTAICMGGEAAGKLFYDESKIKRSGSAPKFAAKTLLGEDGVQTVDDEEHRNRKKYFLNLMTEERIEEWGKLVKKHLVIAASEWPQQASINFYEESKKILTKAVCEWAGVPLPEKDVKKRTNELADMFEQSAKTGPTILKGIYSRHIGTSWAEDLIEQVRNGELNPSEETALYQIAWHKDVNGESLELHPAATDLLNVLRPSTAIAVYFAFIALTLHQFPEIKAKLQDQDLDGDYYDNFVQEIRRYYPFFPFGTGIVRQDFVWNDYQFKKDTLVIFDFYGTGYDARLWDNPDQFNPDRFKDWVKSPTEQIQYKLVAQGGGDYLKGHRCPGEWNTVLAMKIVTAFLVHDIEYNLPKQDLSYSLVHMPSIPESGIIMENIQFKN